MNDFLKDLEHLSNNLGTFILLLLGFMVVWVGVTFRLMVLAGMATASWFMSWLTLVATTCGMVYLVHAIFGE